MPRGGRRVGAGRKPNSATKATVELKAAAAEYTVEMLEVLVSIAKTSGSDSARVAAAQAVLDRGHGKPSQVVDLNVNTKPVSEWTEDEIDRRLDELARQRRGTAAAGEAVPTPGSLLSH